MLLEEEGSHIIIVDDQPSNLGLLVNLLSPEFQVHPFNDGERMLRYLDRPVDIDLFLLDVVMPGIGGFELCDRLRKLPRFEQVPIMFLTALDTEEDEERGLALGAVDFISKPFSAPLVMARVRNQVRLSRAMRFVKGQKEIFEAMVEDRTRELKLKNEELARRAAEIAAIQDVTITACTSLAETRDNETGEHIRRTQYYVKVLALALREHPRFRAELSEESIDLIYKSAPLHDIGKVGIPDSILLKPGRLTPEEFEIMKTHTTIGRDAIARAENLNERSSFLHYAREIAYCHQEKWDGSGYPQGLSGETIPVSARLMTVADVYDALISRRVYKPAFPHEKAVAIMMEERGRTFDPDILDAFLAYQDEFVRIAREFRDAEIATAQKKHETP